MYAKYTLKNNQKIVVFLWHDILKGYNYRKFTTGYLLNKEGNIQYNREFKVDILSDENGKLFFYVGSEKIYFDNFEYMTVDELIKKIKENPKEVKNDEVAATFMKDTNNVGLISVLPEIEFLMPEVAISVFSNQEKEKILCTLSEKDYCKELWSYKLTLEAADEKAKNEYGTQILYLADLVNAIKFGIIDLVNKNEYSKEKEAVKVLK